jgi:hypothetical protein
MDGSKLKHKFVEEDNNSEIIEPNNLVFPADTIQPINPYQDIGTGPLEMVSIQREIVHDVLIYYHLESDLVKDALKKDMVKQLSEILLENNFIEFIEYIDPLNRSTQIKARIKAKKIG